MDRKPFEPADGVTPRWQKLYDVVVSKNIGDEITYREAVEVLGFASLTERTRKAVQETMRETVAHLEKDGERTVGTVAKFGWIVLDPSRELQQVDRRLVKTRRAASRTLRGVQALGTRREELSQFERERLDWVGRAAQVASQASGRRGMDLNELKKMIEGGQTA